MGKNIDLFVSAVIVAAGRGTRMNMDLNKQYIEISGKPVIARTLEVFENCNIINEIILVVNEYDMAYCKKTIIDGYGFNKVKVLVAGGVERQDSVYNGLMEVCEQCALVVVHDGARPFVRKKNIIDSIYTAHEFGASCLAVPVKDTVKLSDGKGFVEETLDRKDLWIIQTPQVFRYDLIMQAYKKCRKDQFSGTDDAQLVERLGVKVKLVTGNYDNIKITTKEDLAIAESIIYSM